MKKEDSIYFSGSMLFISAQTQLLQDINLLKNLMQFHLETDRGFWEEDHKTFLRELLERKQKDSTPSPDLPSPGHPDKPVVLRSHLGQVPLKRWSIQQTSVGSFDFADALQGRGVMLCASCAKMKGGRGRVKVLVQLFNKIANQKIHVSEKYRKKPSLKLLTQHKSHVFRFSPEYFRRHRRNAKKKVRCTCYKFSRDQSEK